MRILMIITIILAVYLIWAGGPEEILPSIKYDYLKFGTEKTLELVTWNIQNFPKVDQTVEYVSDIMIAIDADLYALQEIEDEAAFFAVLNRINQQDKQSKWSGFRANSDEWELNLAFVYKSSQIKVRSIYEIFNTEDDEYAFPRFPLVMEFAFAETPFTVVNNHFKAMPGEENEVRRRLASKRLKEYLDENKSKDNLIVLGDLNDLLTDNESENVFMNFLDDRANYRFADYEIAADSTADWSYPYWKYRSHIDHILISNELYDELNSKSSELKVIVIDRYMEGGEENRYKYITDHRPVGIKLDLLK